MEEKNEHPDNAPLMRSREILLADGRYMIFYTFAGSLSEVLSKRKRTEAFPDPEMLKKNDV
jgi:hypothetical protein